MSLTGVCSTIPSSCGRFGRRASVAEVDQIRDLAGTHFDLKTPLAAADCFVWDASESPSRRFRIGGYMSWSDAGFLTWRTLKRALSSSVFFILPFPVPIPVKHLVDEESANQNGSSWRQLWDACIPSMEPINTAFLFRNFDQQGWDMDRLVRSIERQYAVYNSPGNQQFRVRWVHLPDEEEGLLVIEEDMEGLPPLEARDTEHPS